MNPSNNPRIIVIDDNPDIHSDFRKILAPPTPVASELAAAANALFNRAPVQATKQWFDMDTASQGRDGLEMVKAALGEGRPYEVAFVDMRMPPGWDGLETIVHLWEVQPNLQTIICTAYSDHSWEDINKRLNQSDRFLILKKPFDNVEVHQLASALTSRSRVERELAESTRRLLETSRHAGMAEIATGVLHNVGNVLNSINVSTTLVNDRLRQSKLANLVKSAALFREHETDLVAFLTADPKGKLLPGYLINLAEHLSAEQAELSKELVSVSRNVEHIKDVVAMQQGYAKVCGLMESVALDVLLHDALQINAAMFQRYAVNVVRQVEPVPPAFVDKHKVLQILVNLLRNAIQAVTDVPAGQRRVVVGIARRGADKVNVTVQDNGAGIVPENLSRIFNHGFTTKPDGHGFGLHSGAIDAQEMGGSLTAQSEGPGRGATFTLELPVALPPRTHRQNQPTPSTEAL